MGELQVKHSSVRLLDCDLRTNVDDSCSKPHSHQECHASLHASCDPLHRSGAPFHKIIAPSHKRIASFYERIAPSHKRDVCPVGFNEGYLQANKCMLLKIFLATLFLLAFLLFFNHFETIAPAVGEQASVILNSVNEGFSSLLGNSRVLEPK